MSIKILSVIVIAVNCGRLVVFPFSVIRSVRKVHSICLKLYKPLIYVCEGFRKCHVSQKLPPVGSLLENVIVYKIIKFWRSTVTFVLESTAGTWCCWAPTLILPVLMVFGKITQHILRFSSKIIASTWWKLAIVSHIWRTVSSLGSSSASKMSANWRESNGGPLKGLRAGAFDVQIYTGRLLTWRTKKQRTGVWGGKLIRIFHYPWGWWWWHKDSNI